MEETVGSRGTQWSALTRVPAALGTYGLGGPSCLSAFYPSPWMGESKALSVINNPN